MQSVKEIDHTKEIGLDGRIILKCILNKWVVVVWISVHQNRDKRRTVVNTIMNLRFHKMWGIS